MSEHIIVEFVGFQSKALAREYTFTVRESASEPREFTLTIANEAFVSHRVRYQDAPQICSLKLHRELATYANHPPETHFCITEAELDDYRSAHTHKPPRSPYAHKPQQDF